MKTFSIDQVASLMRKDTSLVLDYMRNEIPNTFVPMREFIAKFGSNARSHIKNLEGSETFRISRLDPNSNSKKETEFWTMVVPNVLSDEELEALTLLLRSEKDEYSEVSFVVDRPTITTEEIEVIQPVVELEVSEESEDNGEITDEQLREVFAYNRSLKQYVCQTCSTEVYKDQRIDHYQTH